MVRSGRGRPRDDSVDDRVLEETLAILSSRGYAGFTLDALVASTGVAKTTILRRWPTKSAVAAAAVQRVALASVDVPDSGSLRGDLLAMLHSAVDVFTTGRGSFVPRLMRESGHHPEIADLLASVVQTRRRAYRVVIARAIARHELSPEVDQDLMVDFLIGPLWTRLLLTGDPLTDEVVAGMVEHVVLGFGTTAADGRVSRQQRQNVESRAGVR